jgi:hypothetical protein
LSRSTLRRTFATLAYSTTLIAGAGMAATAANANGNGPNDKGNETINTSILSTYDEMVAELKRQDQRQSAIELEVIGQSVSRSRVATSTSRSTSPTRPTRRSSTPPSSTATSS